jgi:hypothetical protein
MNRRHLGAVLVASFGYTFTATPRVSARTERPVGLSLIRLIANPKDFDGYRLGVTGYLANNGLDRSLGLYVSEVDARNFVVANSVDLRVDESESRGLVGQYVTLAGTYHASLDASAAYNGYLDGISGLRAWALGDNAK